MTKDTKQGKEHEPQLKETREKTQQPSQSEQHGKKVHERRINIIQLKKKGNSIGITIILTKRIRITIT